MAVYSTTIDATGSEYSSSAGGYQIGGSYGTSASWSITFPESYSSYDSCSVVFKFYARYSPSSWDYAWQTSSITVPVYLKYNTGSEQLIWYLESSELQNYSSSTRNCTFTIDIDNDLGAPAFKPGDTLTFRFEGLEGMYINASEGRCLYLVDATFTSYAATPASQKKYLIVKGYTATYVSQYTSGSFYVEWADYRKYWGFSWEPYDYMLVTLDGNGGGYYSDVTYYVSTNQYLTDGNGNRLYIPD